jgi:hypothetical protein
MSSQARRGPRRSQSDSPWNERDFLRTTGFVVLGVTLLAVCWFASSGEADFQSQIVWVAGGAASIVVAGIGLGGWLLAGIREVHREMYEVTAGMKTIVLHSPPEVMFDEVDDLDRPVSPPAAGRAVYVIGAGMSRVHVPDCVLVRGKPTSEVGVPEILARGLGYCEVCCA